MIKMTTTMGPKKTKMFRAVLVAGLMVCSGCNQKSKATPENYQKGLNAYLAERPDCLLPDGRFPFETGDPVEMKRMETLVAAQMLTVTYESAIKVARYVPTPLGAKVAPHFCYGHREATSILSSTPPAVANGFNETNVVYQYAMRDVPVWAKSAAVKAAFPAMAEKISGTATDKAVLAQTRVGWQVPD